MPAGGLLPYVARIRVRRRWRAYLGTALLLGLTAGTALLAVAGARRTVSAYDRFLRSVNASTMSVTSNRGFSPQVNRTIARAPEVEQSRSWVGISVFVARPGQRTLTAQDIETDGTLDGEYFLQDRFTTTRGRLADPRRADEVVVNEFAAKRFDLHVGEHVTLQTYSTDQVANPDPTRRGPPKAITAATVSGIGLFPDEVLQDDADRIARLLLTPAFTQRQARWTSYGVQELVLRRGARDVETMKQRIARLEGPGTVSIRVTSVDAFHARQAVRPLAVALALFGVIVGMAGLVLVIQGLARLLRAEQNEANVFRALGIAPRAAVSVALVGPLVAIVTGLVLAVFLAAIASPLMPIGPLRRVEAAPGFNIDGVVLGVGAVVAFAVLAGTSFALARRAASTPRAAKARSGRVADAAADAGLTSPAVVGLRFATETTAGAPSRSVMAGGVVAIAALVGALTFGASLDTLIHDHDLYGWSSDGALLAASGYGNIPLAGAHTILDADPSIAAWSGAYFGAATIDGRREIPLLGMEPNSTVMPPLLQGAQLRGAGDIVLGRETAVQLHVHVGQSVAFAGTGSVRELRVVGIATFPTIGRLQAAHTSLGVGALVAPQLVPGADRNITGDVQRGVGPHVIFVRFRSGADTNAALEHLRTTTRPLADFAGLEVLPVQRPAEIVNSGNMGTAPTVMAVALAAGATVSLALALHASVRRHRRDLALLKTLGFTRGQLAATTASQATVTTVVAVALGVPIGLFAGRVLWEMFAQQLDVLARPAIPLAAIVTVSVAAVLIGNAAAAVPGRNARQVKAALLLRAE
jgi:predicted lysophospholipase L1 biosynthesis ABC-type transport system permease subunit